jgi:pyruvate/2-oxoglutarate dehydrogenase complex dihydrolipoamide acyltransferase (E2) component
MSAEAPASTPTGAKGALDPIEPTGAQRAVARRAAEAKATIPDFHVVIAVPAAPGAGVAPYVAAAGRALRAVASVNGAYADAKYQHYSRANVGVVLEGATPVVVDADAKDAAAIAAELEVAAEQARAGTLPGAAQSGATFSIDLLTGVDAFTTIIQPGHAAALAIALPDGGATATLTLSADRRIVTPADAAAFLGRVRDALLAVAV